MLIYVPITSSSEQLEGSKSGCSGVLCMKGYYTVRFRGSTEQSGRDGALIKQR